MLHDVKGNAPVMGNQRVSHSSSILARFCGRLDLTPKQFGGALLAIPLFYLVVLIWTVAF